MNLLMIPRLALKALRQNVMRTALTMLGIIIGVGAVICVVAIGEGAQASVERAITNIGANMIWVEAGGVNRSGVRTGIGRCAVGRGRLLDEDAHHLELADLIQLLQIMQERRLGGFLRDVVLHQLVLQLLEERRLVVAQLWIDPILRI